ncbi:UNVERIFIED_CONTAM: uncharacterized protein DUF4386 [Acetivibrio alkalicellulosi]
MLKNIPIRLRAILVGTLIIVAFSMLTYNITKHITIGVIADLISGLAVIGIAVLMFPLFNSAENKRINYIYLYSKIIEGILMIIGGVLILSPTLVGFRSVIYENIHVYFFIMGALFLYILLYRIRAIPRFISIWGICASVMLFIMIIIKLLGIRIDILDILLLPIVLNEFFLAFWLIIKGFNEHTSAASRKIINLKQQ